MKKTLKKNGVKMMNKENDKIEVRRKDISYTCACVKRDERQEFINLLHKELFSLEDKEGHPLRQQYEEPFFVGQRAILKFLIKSI